MSAVSLTIDGRPVTVPEGTTLYDAARRLGIDVPVLCHHPRLRPVGVCRLCVVDVGGRVLAASCVRTCEEGMKVETRSPRVENQRQMLTALLLAEHPTPCAKEQTMLKEVLLTTLLVLTPGGLLFAQATATINGRVVDQAGGSGLD